MNAKPLKQKLEAYCEFINGGAWNESEYTDSGIPVLKVSNIKNQTFSLDDIDYLSIEGAKKYAKNILNQYDLIVATVGSHPNLINSAAGRTISVPKSLQGYLLNQNAVCIRTKDNDVLFQPYLRYIGETDFFRAYIQARGKGAANQMRIAIGEIKDFPINLPKLAIQKKIAAILSAYDDLIENNLKRIKLLEEMAQITYEEWFVRLKFPSHETTPLDSATGLPVGWRRITLDDACDVSGGGTPSTEVDEYWNGGDIAWFSPTDLSKNNSLVLLDSAQKITQKGLQKSSAKLMQPTGFMMTSRATIGLFGLFDKPFCTNQGFINVIPKHESHKYFLLFNFKLRVPEFLNYASGATFPELSKSKFKRLKIDWPTETIFEKWHEVSNPMIQEITNLSKQNQLLKEARDILLPRLMTGMIDVEQLVLPEPFYNPSPSIQESQAV